MIGLIAAIAGLVAFGILAAVGLWDAKRYLRAWKEADYASKHRK